MSSVSQVKIAIGVKTITQMGSEPIWEDLKDEVGFPSDNTTYDYWPAEPSYRGTWFRYYEELTTNLAYSNQAQGYPMADWRFDYITRIGMEWIYDEFITSASQLSDYSATVTIQMVDEFGQVVTYNGVMLWPRPDEDMRRAPLGQSNILFRFRQLVVSSA
jgi:hypothetical protein